MITRRKHRFPKGDNLLAIFIFGVVLFVFMGLTCVNGQAQRPGTHEHRSFDFKRRMCDTVAVCSVSVVVVDSAIQRFYIYDDEVFWRDVVVDTLFIDTICHVCPTGHIRDSVAQDTVRRR